MYSDGDRKTLSELQRESLDRKKKIAEKNAQIERTWKSLGRVEQTVDQCFRLFARGVEKSDREKFMELLLSYSEDIDLGSFPLIPFILALANGSLCHVRSIRAVNNPHVDDGTVIFLAHVLRFSPAILQLNTLDISGTKVTVKGLFFLLEMMAERATGFTLIAKNRLPSEVATPTTFKETFDEVLQRVEKNKLCKVAL